MRRHALWCLTLAMLPVAATAAPEPQEAEQDPLDALYACYRAGTEAISENRRTVDFGPSSEAFFIEQLGAAMQSLGPEVSVSWCGRYFVDPYVRAHMALHGPTQNTQASQEPERPSTPAHGPHMPLSSNVHLAKEERLIQLAAHMGGVSHVALHADMVRHAMATPAVASVMRKMALSTCAKGLIMQGAQVPDLYLFDEDLWHGHSLTARQSEWSRRQFVDLVVQVARRGQRAYADGNTQQAMVLFGAGAHAVQDLLYHRGMTLSERSALTFVAHNNPDWPGGAVGQRLHREATLATGQFLAAALKPIAQKAVAQKNAADEDHEDLWPVIASLWPEAVPLDYSALRAYYALSAPFDPAAQSLPEERLTQALALAHAHRGHWAVGDTLQDILGAL